MGKLPRKEDACEDKRSRIECPGTSSPPHQWRDGSDDGTDPSVVEADSLEWCVDCDIQEDVSYTEERCEWVDCGPQEGPSC